MLQINTFLIQTQNTTKLFLKDSTSLSIFPTSLECKLKAGDFSLCCACCAQSLSCVQLYDRMDCRLPSFSVHGDSPGKNTGVGCHALLQGIFPTQGLNPGLPHCRWICYHLSLQGKPKNTGVSSLSPLQGIFPTQELNQALLHGRRILNQMSYQGNPISVYRKKRKKGTSLSRVQLFATPWAVAYQAPPSVEFSRQEYWSGVPLPSQSPR